jgi:hypothetical protein
MGQAPGSPSPQTTGERAVLAASSAAITLRPIRGVPVLPEQIFNNVLPMQAVRKAGWCLYATVIGLPYTFSRALAARLAPKRLQAR